jgi:hypothetical protein
MGKSSTQLTPAQKMSQDVAIQNAQRNQSFWFPIQQYFSQRLNTEAPGLKEQERGQSESSARSQVDASMGKVLDKDAAAGAAPGSGKYILDATKGSEASATSGADALTAASSDADKAYVKGLQTVVQMGQKDQAVAQQGLAAAGQEEAQEASLKAQSDAEQQQGIGTLLGSVTGLVT